MTPFSASNRGRRTDHAVSSSGHCPDRGWFSSLAHQPIHPHGGIHQGDIECRGGHCCGHVAAKRYWEFMLPLLDHCVEVILPDGFLAQGENDD